MFTFTLNASQGSIIFMCSLEISSPLTQNMAHTTDSKATYYSSTAINYLRCQLWYLQLIQNQIIPQTSCQKWSRRISYWEDGLLHDRSLSGFSSKYYDLKKAWQKYPFLWVACFRLSMLKKILSAKKNLVGKDHIPQFLLKCQLNGKSPQKITPIPSTVTFPPKLTLL